MSKKKSKIEIDKFYNFYGGKSHPSLVYEKTNRKTYKALKFGTTRGKHMTEIKKRPTHKTKRAKRRYENQKKPPNHKSS